MKDVIFNDIHSIDDLGLVLTDYHIGPAEPKRYVVDVPGMDGDLELTESISEVKFKNRQIVLEFGQKDMQQNWEENFAKIKNAIHGRRMKVSIEEEHEWYWNAFVTVQNTDDNVHVGQYTVNLDAYPYQLSTENRRIETVATAEGATVICDNSRMNTVPVFTIAENVSVRKGDVIVSFTGTGAHKNAAMILTEGMNELVITGSGKVIIEYQEGRL